MIQTFSIVPATEITLQQVLAAIIAGGGGGGGGSTYAYKVLGQEAPSATTETDLYTVPAATSTLCNSITICNRGATIQYFRVSISVGGVATSNADYLYYNVPLAANDTFIATIGLTMAATDVMRVYASSGDLSFQLYGIEIS